MGGKLKIYNYVLYVVFYAGFRLNIWNFPLERTAIFYPRYLITINGVSAKF